MTEEPVGVRVQFEQIEIHSEDLQDDIGMGHIDMGVWLERGSDVLCAVDVRLYFNRTDISLDDLRASALVQAHRALSQVVELYKPDLSASGPEGLWKE
jgi:hypothetical protein